jgi:capsid portal protein
MKSENISIMNFSQIELPKGTESTRHEWVEFGVKNEFPQYLMDLSYRSALHNAIIRSKTLGICGNGLEYEKKKDSKTDTFIASPNPNETLEELLYKFAYDLELFGGFYINVIWDKGKNKISEIYHIDYQKIRSGICDEKGVVQKYYYSDDWSNYRKYGFKPKEINAFNTKTGGSQLIFIRPYSPGQKYYTLPGYVGALSYIETDVEIGNFHLAHIKNGMAPSMSITFTNGVPTEEERRIIERKLEQKYNSTDNAGKFILNFVDDVSRKPIIETLSPAQLDKQFLQLQDTVLQNILSGHRVTSPLLVGIKTAGQLGGGTEMFEAYSIYKNTVILPERKIVMDAINKIGAINGLQELIVINNDPISVEFSYSEATLLQIMTVDELREIMNYDPLKEGDVTVVNSAGVLANTTPEPTIDTTTPII